MASFVALDPSGWLVFAPVKWTIVTTGTAAIALSIRTWRANLRWTLGWTAFLAWGAIVSLTAVDPLYTWLGTPDRHLGLIAWVQFGVWFVAGQSLDRRSILRSAAITACLVSLIAIAEWLGAPPVELATSGERLTGPFGSPTYLGAALVLLIPLCGGLAADTGERQQWRIVAAVGMAASVAVLVGTQTRAASVALVAAAVIGFPRLRASDHRRLISLGLAAVVLVGAFSPLAGRLAGTLAEGGQSRLDEWSTGVAAVADRPVLGAGFEGYRIVFGSVVDREYQLAYGRDVLPDRAHNGLLDVAITTGIPGAALYLVAMLRLGAIAVRALRSGSVSEAGIAAAVLAFIIHQQFLFPLAEVDHVFWLCAGLLLASRGGGERELPRPAWAAGALVVLVVFAGWMGGRDVAADRSVANAFGALEYPTAVDAVERATQLRPDSIRYWLARAEVHAGPQDAGGLERALESVAEAERLSPDDPGVLRSRTRLMTLHAILHGTDQQRLTTESVLQAAIATDPLEPAFRLQRGSLLAVMNQHTGAEDAIQTAIDLDPDSPDGFVALTVLYIDLEDLAAAAGTLAQLRVIAPTDPRIPSLELRVEEMSP